MGSIFDIGGYFGYDASLAPGLEDNLSLTRTISAGIIPAFSATERGQNAVFSCDVVFPISPSDSVLFEQGGTGVGAFVGIVSGGTIFRARAGEGDAAIDVTSDDGVVLDILDFPRDGLVHNVVWDIRVNPGRIRLWIDGIFKGERSTTTGLALESSIWAGTDDGGYLQTGTNTVQVAGQDASAPWAGGTAGASTLRYYQNQLALPKEKTPRGIWSISGNHQILSSQLVTDGLVLYLDASNSASYPGSGSVWYDLSGNNNHGTLVNSPTFSNNHFTLNGTNQYVSFGGAPNSLKTTYFTLSTWFQWATGGSTSNTGAGGIDYYPIITKGRAEADGDNRDMNYGVGITATAFVGADFEDNSTGLNAPITGTQTLPQNIWKNVSVVYDGTWYIYIDGTLTNTLSINRTPRNDSIQHNAIGTAMNSTGVVAGYFSGRISMAQIYNRALPSSEIQQNFNVTRGRYGI